MSIRDMEGKTFDKIPVRNVLLSTFDKSGLEEFVASLTKINPYIRFLSTGGTYKKIKDVLGADADNSLMEVSEYTEFPEMEGGLVKTLHPKIHAGILGERDNPAHGKYLAEDLNKGVYIDMVVVNLYPFESVIAKPDVTFESARGNIDIGGPTMIRAAAKNFPGCAAVCDPRDYQLLLSNINDNDGCTTFDMRLELAKKVFAITGAYDTAINNFMERQLTHPEKIRGEYNLTERLD